MLTYSEYYRLLVEDIKISEESTNNQYILLRGEKGYMDPNEIRAYKKLTFDLFLLNAKAEELLKLFRKGEINFNDLVDPFKLVFSVRHFEKE